jgi:hypothetical protein
LFNSVWSEGKTEDSPVFDLLSKNLTFAIERNGYRNDSVTSNAVFDGFLKNSSASKYQFLSRLRFHRLRVPIETKGRSRTALRWTQPRLSGRFSRVSHTLTI